MTGTPPPWTAAQARSWIWMSSSVVRRLARAGERKLPAELEELARDRQLSERYSISSVTRAQAKRPGRSADTMRAVKTAPRRDRPQLPKGYIKAAPRGMLTWVAVKKILTTFPYLWIASVDDDGRPHLVQQWGVWVDDVLYFEGSDKTRWARNLARDPRLAFGMQNGDRAVYGEAVVDVVHGPDRRLATKIARQYAAKYGRGFKYRPKPEQYEKGHVFRARPEKLIAFDVKKFETSAARFTF